MDCSKEVYQRDDKFLRVFSVVSGVIVVIFAAYILSQVFGLLSTLP